MEKEIDTNIAELESTELNDIDSESSNDDYVEEPKKNKPSEPERSFEFGEQRVKFSNGVNEVECHFTNSNPIEASNIAIQLLKQHHDLTHTTKPTPEYLK